MFNQNKERFDVRGFTLSEILIVLGIIGVLAMMTIPSLVKNIQDAQYKTAYKKVFSVANQAILIANQQNLLASAAGEGDYLSHQNNFLAFMAQFKVIKKCVNNNNSECWEDTGEKYDSGAGWYPQVSTYAFIDASGVAWSMFYGGIFYLFVDTNGFKAPNQWGKDRFVLWSATSEGKSNSGIPIRFLPITPDGSPIGICSSKNKCTTEQNYYGKSWLYN